MLGHRAVVAPALAIYNLHTAGATHDYHHTFPLPSVLSRPLLPSSLSSLLLPLPVLFYPPLSSSLYHRHSLPTSLFNLTSPSSPEYSLLLLTHSLYTLYRPLPSSPPSPHLLLIFDPHRRGPRRQSTPSSSCASFGPRFCFGQRCQQPLTCFGCRRRSLLLQENSSVFWQDVDIRGPFVCIFNLQYCRHTNTIGHCIASCTRTPSPSYP